MKKIYEEIQIRIEMDEVKEERIERERYENLGYTTSSQILSDENGEFYLLVAKKSI